jgi:hypothetical protein
VDEGITKVRAWFATNEGGPNWPVSGEPVRVSTTRQGVIETKTKPDGSPFEVDTPTFRPLVVGTLQFLTGIGSSRACCARPSGASETATEIKEASAKDRFTSNRGEYFNFVADMFEVDIIPFITASELSS